MYVKKLIIRKFRHINNLSIDFCEGVNAIAGQNGTGKSSILGLIGHAGFRAGYAVFHERALFAF